MPIPTHGLTGAAFIDGFIHVPDDAVTHGGNIGSTIHQAYFAALSCSS